MYSLVALILLLIVDDCSIRYSSRTFGMTFGMTVESRVLLSHGITERQMAPWDERIMMGGKEWNPSDEDQSCGAICSGTYLVQSKAASCI